MFAPIILFVYNRPWHTQLTVEALQRNDLAAESELFVFCDGPKETATEEQKAKIKEVREYVHNIKGFKNIHIEESEQNKGLANSVIAGVTKIINEYGKVIVVEDDIVTHPFFLRFMNDSLDFYQTDSKIFCIGGMVEKIEIPSQYTKDVLVTPRVESWGWATWKDRWLSCNWDVTKYKVLKTQKKKDIKRICRGGDDLWPMLQAQADGKIDSWAIRWHYNMVMQEKLCLRPVFSFVRNIGMDGSGVHCTSSSSSLALSTPLYAKTEYSIKCEANIKENRIIVRNAKRYYSSPSISIIRRMIRKAKKLLLK